MTRDRLMRLRLLAVEAAMDKNEAIRTAGEIALRNLPKIKQRPDEERLRND